MKDLKYTPTIAQLWDKLKAALDTNLEARLTQDTTDSGKHGTPPSLSIAISDAKIKALRQQLVERCEKVWDADGVYTRFTIYTERGVTNPRTFVQSMGGSRFDTPETAANYIGAYAFWAWELQQREKEAANG